MKTSIVTMTAILALAACTQQDPVADNLQNADSLPVSNTPEASPTGAPPANAGSNAAAPAAPSGAIPPALQGRWGLTPVDCTTALGDAKGLLVINANELRFYESRAVPSPGIQTSADSASGNFAFTGEGQEWTKYEALHAQGDKLVRTERDPNASFTYVRCQ
jgi:hypothetical protein